MLFGMLSRVDLRDHVLDGVGPGTGTGNIEGGGHRHARRHSDVSCAQTAELEWLWMDSGGPKKA